MNYILLRKITLKVFGEGVNEKLNYLKILSVFFLIFFLSFFFCSFLLFLFFFFFSFFFPSFFFG